MEWLALTEQVTVSYVIRQHSRLFYTFHSILIHLLKSAFL